MKGLLFLTFLAIFSMANLNIVAGQCETITAKVNACLTRYHAVTDFSKGTFSAANLREYCSNKADGEVQCAENAVKRCKENSQFREILEKVIDINAFRNSIDIVCDPNNTAALAEQESCLTRYIPVVKSCVVGASLDYRREILYGGSEDELLEETCELFGDLKECQRPFGDNCGRDIQVIFDAMNHGITPPACVAIATGDVDRHCDSFDSGVGTCLSGYHRVTDFTKGEWSAADIGEYCTNKVDGEVECAENAVKRCRQVSSNFRKMADKVIDVDVYRSSMNIVCDPKNIAALGEKEDCIARYAPGVQSCARPALTSYLAKSRSSRSEDEIYEALCMFMRDLKECQEKFGDKCGKDIQIFFDAINQAITPPVCSAVAKERVDTQCDPTAIEGSALCSAVTRSGNILVLMSFALLAFLEERW